MRVVKRQFQISSRSLWISTLIYLGLPVVIFLLGWLKLPLALFVLASLAASAYFSNKCSDNEPPIALSYWATLVVAFACLGLCILAGVGGFAYQDGDYFKHNAIFADLFRRDWPVSYTVTRNNIQHPAALVYYIAYYLPPALVGKIAGWEALRFATILWTACGLLITSLWCLRYSRGALWGPLAFLAFGGFDLFGTLLGIKVFHWMPELWLKSNQMEWWTGFPFGNYPGHSGHFFWAPQHALPGWLVTAAVVYRIRSKTLDGCLLLAALTPLWSPLITVGLLPVGLAGLIAYKGKGALTISNLSALPLFFVIGLFFVARGLPLLPIPSIPTGWNDWTPLKLASTFVIEVLPWTLLLIIPYKSEKSTRIIVFFCAVFLAFLPLWRVGAFNDLMMRSSLPAFAALSFLLLQRATNASSVWKKTALAALLMGSGGLAFDIRRHIEFAGIREGKIDFSEPSKIPSLPATPDLTSLLSQYLGSPQSGFFRKLARSLPPVVDPVAYDEMQPPPGAIESQDILQMQLRHRFERGERSQAFLQEYATLCYFQRDFWESLLALETMVKHFPQDPNARINLATLLSTSNFKAFQIRALSELDAARPLAQDPAEFDRATGILRKSLTSGQ